MIRRRGILQKKPPGLMLTSLLDMFTIILIFLIVSFDAENYDFKLNPDLKLPESTTRSILKPAVNIEITKNAVIMEKKVVLRLVNRRAPQAYYDSQEIPELVKLMQAEFELRFGDSPVSQEPVMAGDNELDSREPIVVVQADKELDYETLYLVLRSAAMAGFFKYRLATLRI